MTLQTVSCLLSRLPSSRFSRKHSIDRKIGGSPYSILWRKSASLLSSRVKRVQRVRRQGLIRFWLCVDLQPISFWFPKPESVAWENFSFGARMKKISRHNEKKSRVFCRKAVPLFLLFTLVIFTPCSGWAEYLPNTSPKAIGVRSGVSLPPRTPIIDEERMKYDLIRHVNRLVMKVIHLDCNVFSRVHFIRLKAKLQLLVLRHCRQYVFVQSLSSFYP